MRKIWGCFAILVLATCGCQPVEEKPKLTENPNVFTMDITPGKEYTPQLEVLLPDGCPVPAGLALEPMSGKIFVNVLNSGKICAFKGRHTLEILAEYDSAPATALPRGLAFGPEGHLYVCDRGRILRLDLQTKKMTAVAEGLGEPTDLLWHEDVLYVADARLADGPTDAFGCGGVWRFTKAELRDKSLKLTATTKDPHVWAICPVSKVGREDSAGLGGLAWAWDALYGGNFGDGVMFRMVPDGDSGKAKMEKALDEPTVHCCAGMAYDPKTDLLYLCDSQANAIRTLSKTGVPGWIWLNKDTTGDDGELDQPASCVIRDGLLYIANQDVPLPGMKNSVGPDKPYSISTIPLEPWTRPAPPKVKEVKPEDIRLEDLPGEGT